jgi:hypothetical protein
MFNIEKINPKYDNDQIKDFKSNGEFMDASVELLKQTIELIYFVVGLKYCDENGQPVTISKDDAVVAGNLVRLIKLNTSFLQNICEGKLEIGSLLNRCIAETQINVKYMLIEGEERVRRNYIKYSLITEKELWNTICDNISKRNGDVLPIEDRMQISIKNSFDKSDFDLDEVKHSSKWKSVASRAELVAGDIFYDIFYGISSHSVHGNWQDILIYNLEKTEDGFKIKLDWHDSKPQIIDGPIILNLDIVDIFLDKELKTYSNFDILKGKIQLLNDYQIKLTDYHEKYLTNKYGS